MIIVTGIDIIQNSRILSAMKNPRFLERILTSAERGVNLHPVRVAGRWAAKEAVAKCLLQLGIQLSWKDVAIFNDLDGRPYVEIYIQNSKLEHKKIHISISHEKNYSVASAILEECN